MLEVRGRLIPREDVDEDEDKVGGTGPGLISSGSNLIGGGCGCGLDEIVS